MSSNDTCSLKQKKKSTKYLKKLTKDKLVLQSQGNMETLPGWITYTTCRFQETEFKFFN